MVKAKVLDVDVDKERISLGIKQLTEDTVAAELDQLKKGAVVTCTISKIVNTGIEVMVNETPGFIRKGDLSRDRSEQRPDRFATGEKIDAKITQVDKASRNLTLSIKALEVEEEKKAMKNFGSSDAGASLGDILGAAIQKKADDDKDGDKAEAETMKKAPAKARAKAKADDKTEDDKDADKAEMKETKKKAPAKAKAEDKAEKKETKKKAPAKAKAKAADKADDKAEKKETKKKAPAKAKAADKK